MKTKKIKFVPLESDAFLTDPDFIAMTPDERGVYITMILLLYSSGGSVKLKDSLHLVFGCSSDEFKIIFTKISFKFRIKNGKIFHKKVSKVLAAQKKFLQVSRNKGLKGMASRWGSDSTAITNENETKSKTKDKDKSNSKRDCLNSSADSTTTKVSDSNSSISPAAIVRSSNSLREQNAQAMPGQSPFNAQASQSGSRLNCEAILFIDKLGKILFAKTRSDRTAFNNVTNFLTEGVRSGKFNLEIFARALQYAKESKSGDNPNALFMSLMKSQLGYERSL